MRFHKVIEEVIGGRLPIRVFRVLVTFPSKEFTGRELARTAGADASKTIQYLNTLLDHGLVERRTVGHSQLWRLRQGHYLVKKLGPVLGLERAAIGDLYALISKKLRAIGVVETAIIFGSVARGEERPDSDIDLFILVDGKSEKNMLMLTLEELAKEVADSFGNPLTPVVYTRRELSQKRDLPLVASIRREGVLVLGAGLENGETGQG